MKDVTKSSNVITPGVLVKLSDDLITGTPVWNVLSLNNSESVCHMNFKNVAMVIGYRSEGAISGYLVLCNGFIGYLFSSCVQSIK